MKNFKTLEKELKKVQTIKNEDKFDYLGVKDFLNLSKEEKEIYHDKRVEHDKKRADIRKENEIITLKRATIKHNLLCALYEEVAPVILDILSNYQNKQLGPKTKEKIKNDFFERTGHKMYFDANYGDSFINVYTLDAYGYSNNGYDLTIAIVDKEGERTMPTDENNRIKDIKEIATSCRYNATRYIENVNKYVKDYVKAYVKAYKAQQELEKLCSDCNQFVIKDIDDVYFLHRISEKYM